MADIEARIAALEEFAAKVTEQFYKDRTWERPVPPRVEHPETTAAVSNVVEASTLGTVFMNYCFRCATCGATVTDNLSVSSRERNPFTRLLSCPEKHPNKVVFHVDKNRN